MKLRISGNSIRLRLLRSEVVEFIETGRIENTLNFNANASFSYALEHGRDLTEVAIRPQTGEVTIMLPVQQARSWADSDQTGIYATLDLGSTGSLEISVEKDFACLDLSDADNHDTFPNPQIGAAC